MSQAPSSTIPFNRPPLTGRELEYIQQVFQNRHFSGDGPFTKKCHEWLKTTLHAHGALLTHSATAALEMAMILANLEPGDEVILPSFTFVSCANAIALRGAIPVFIDVRPDTMNIDEKKIEAAITPKTKAILAVHYAGVACEMDTILAIAKKHKLMVIEDAAQALLSEYKGKPLGTIGSLSAFSFHETKNVVSGEGGALVINDETLHQRAEIVREKGTNRSLFFRGMVDKYTWVDIGSSYLPSEILAAVLFAQFEHARQITDARLAIWSRYHERFADLEKQGKVRRPIVPLECKPNGHLYYLIANSLDERTAFIAHMKKASVSSVFHYIPLHSAPAGLKYGRTHGSLDLTQEMSDRLVRLPLYYGMSAEEFERVVSTALDFYQGRA